MPPQRDPGRRAELLEQVVDYLLERGVAELSLRPLARAVGTSTYALTYHFDSREGVIVAALAAVEERQRVLVERWAQDEELTLPDLVRRYWRWSCTSEGRRFIALAVEILAIAARHPERYAGAWDSAMAPWHASLRADLGGGQDAQELAALIVATVSGHQLALLAGEDADRLTRALDLFLARLHGALPG